MSETQETVVKNPYAAENMPEGGGLTRDIVVTGAKYVLEAMTRKDGSAVYQRDKEGHDTKERAFFVGLRIEGLSTDPRAEGKTAKYDYSSGKKAKPSADGEMLLDDKGAPAPIYKTSNLGKAIEGLRKGGFDPAQLYPRVSILVGAKLTLAGTDQKDATGKIKTYIGTDKKPHNSIEWFPEKYSGGAGTRAANGNGTAVADLTAKAQLAVVNAIAASGGSIERKDIFRALATALKGDADAVRVSTLVARQDFAWPDGVVVDGSKLTLGA